VHRPVERHVMAVFCSRSRLPSPLHEYWNRPNAAY
jgi:hypothetical protein